MTPLPDVNVLIALVWESHLHHAPARSWFSSLDGAPWATCSVTQTGFVRVSSNPRVLADAISVRQAVATLAALIDRPSHQFLADDAGFVANPLVPHDRLIGHRQVTDAHLLAVARRHDCALTTFDSGVTALGDDVVTIAV